MLLIFLIPFNPKPLKGLYHADGKPPFPDCIGTSRGGGSGSCLDDDVHGPGHEGGVSHPGDEPRPPPARGGLADALDDGGAEGVGPDHGVGADGGAVAYMDLIAAIDAGVDINILKHLISKCDNINGCDENGQTALHHCVQNYVSLDLLNELFIAGINSAALDNKGLDARDYLDKDIWGDDYGTARMMLRPCWAYFYDE